MSKNLVYFDQVNHYIKMDKTSWCIVFMFHPFYPVFVGRLCVHRRGDCSEERVTARRKSFTFDIAMTPTCTTHTFPQKRPFEIFSRIFKSMFADFLQKSSKYLKIKVKY